MASNKLKNIQKGNESINYLLFLQFETCSSFHEEKYEQDTKAVSIPINKEDHFAMDLKEKHTDDQGREEKRLLERLSHFLNEIGYSL